MLEKFTVENYKGFSKPITLDFSNTRDYKFNEICIKNGLLNKVIIYGPNSSGKSNLGFALFDIVGLLTDKNTYYKQTDQFTFLNADSGRTEAVFTYVFKKGNTRIEYCYKKSDPKTLTYEKLSVDGKVVFEYDFVNQIKTLENMQLINAENLNFDYFQNNFAVLRYVAYNTPQPDDSYIKFIMNYVSNMLWFRSVELNEYIGFTTGVENIDEWIADNGYAKDFQRFIKTQGNIDVDLDTYQDPAYNHKLLVENHKYNRFIFGTVASSGTKAMQLFYYWSKKFKEVSLLFMDEFDAYYHFDLAKNIIKILMSFDNMQAIVTTHNSYLADNGLLRPDCYFNIVDGELKSFADSTDRELREGHNLEKMLRNGEFNG